jgi:hypothetical protein
MIQSKFSALLILFVSVSVIGVSAYVFEQRTQSLTQNIVNVASFTLRNCDLGPLKEGETRTYDKAQIDTLEEAIKIQVDDSVSHVDLNLDSDLYQLSDFYSTYDIVVRFSKVVGDTYSSGDIACTLSIGAEDYSSIELDEPGIWSFDFELTTTAKSVAENTPSTVTAKVTAEEL